MKINLISRKLIKPTTQTPQHLNQYSISFTDEFCPPMNVRILLFYTSASKRICRLQKSLSEILPRFYPLAGRYTKNDHVVDCNDEGAEFIEAEATDVESMDLIRAMECDQLNHFFSRQFHQMDESAACPLLSVQATHFKCGGLAVGISVTHRIFDGSSLETFVQAWSDHSAAGGTAITPSFDSPSLLPRGDLDCTPTTDKSEMRNISICAKRFLFTAAAITRLRYKLGREESDPYVSRVRAVCALIAKALINLDRARHGRSRPCLVVQAFNVRKRTVPPLRKDACGNFAVQSVTRSMSAAEAERMSVGGLVGVLGEAIEKTTSDCSRILCAGAGGLNEMVMEPTVNAVVKSWSGEANVIWFSDWSKFEYSKTDFGWGKAEWASIGPVAVENTAVLTETGEDGEIEAWVHLKSNHMGWFEEDEGIRLFTKLM
ncbi:pelargonidin 3-O-(6-caffeoylglucoside) 5-O-(6-O-malonylglucoside) 4'''-malonyltransferase-like [Salvia miltiorrhiza]|uniref:pelargonidin 3-O-(6-caffeoylglucoside) 5-O-(6-O-malonylglucoside) 4'''-malonyltransferase-like n=1 Tax=Salvia miltiorrhiza TaxID=226208 RepID=UPI0025ABF3A8|nr:pelargonidin 3-O-(6-caffeoylglucoside) 5-O-(6-O-malonylglucoside) 4'''-malonyltransferase-like [Salvia miltiorrhiza]